jgi:hypothetical protein
MSHKTLAKLCLKTAAAQAQAAQHKAADLTFAQLAKAYSATVYDGAEYALRKWLLATGETSAWLIERDVLEHCMQAMAAHGYKPSTIKRDIDHIATLCKWARGRKLAPRASAARRAISNG